MIAHEWWRSVANQPKEGGDSSDVAIICVKDYQAAANVSSITEGLIETTNKGLIVVQCSTISPEESNKLAHLYSNRQIRMLTIPILGGTVAVQKGEITLIAAGPKTAYDLAEPILRDLSSQIFYLGSDHRTASSLKLAFNIHIALIALALAEGLVFARGTGVDTNTFIKVLNSTYFKTGISERKGPRILNDDYNASFCLANMVKDLGLALRTAYTSGLTLPIAASAEAVYRASEASGLSTMDYTSVASYLSSVVVVFLLLFLYVYTISLAMEHTALLMVLEARRQLHLMACLIPSDCRCSFGIKKTI